MIRKLLICAVMLPVLCACGPGKKEREEEKEKTHAETENRPVGVKAVKTDLTDFHYDLIANGMVSAAKKAELRFQSQEHILCIYVRNGQQVKKGQMLAELDRFKLENACALSKENFEKARLDLQDVLIGLGYAIADSAKVPAETMRIARIRSNYDQSRNNYIMAEYNYKAAALYAPFDGVVADLKAKEYNQPGSEPFCVVMDNRQPDVTFNILETELPLVRLNDKVTVSPYSQPDFQVEGRVTEINPVIDKNGMVQLKAMITNRDNAFLDGMNVKVKVQRLLGKCLVIPKSALLLRTNRKVVFTLKEGRAYWNYVQTAQENSDSYVVTEGINPGDSVIYDNNINLAHDVKVEVRN